MSKLTRKYGLSSNTLKIIAAIVMVIDHIGVILFPSVGWLRIIGRSAFPIFSFLICEGCRYTKNKARYLIQMLILGAVTSGVYFYMGQGVFLCVPFTFSCSIVLIYTMQFIRNSKNALKMAGCILLIGLIAGFYVLAQHVNIDYGFWGIMLPVFSAMIPLEKTEEEHCLAMQNRFYGFAIGLILISLVRGMKQPYSLFALIPLAFYNGQKGPKLPKYFFYIFYPAHIAIIWLVGQMLFSF